MKREIVLDTETTGLETKLGHRIIEIGCIELINRQVTENHFHIYLNPEREIDAGALQVHGISKEFLQDKPKFAAIREEFLNYIEGATLIIHNAPFDVGFINYELSLIKTKKQRSIDKYLTIVDTLALARRMFPGQRNSLDALCKRFQVDNSNRALHGALLDASLLAQVYLTMTGGQISMFANANDVNSQEKTVKYAIQEHDYKVVKANATEEKAHKQYLDELDKTSSDKNLWQKITQEDA